jgi:hypothetical protein
MAISAVLSALGVILLALGSLVGVLDLSTAALASFLTVFAVIELKGKYPYLIYVVTGALALLLLPTKTSALVYLFFAGYYPMVKAAAEKHLGRVLSWVVKLAVFCVGAVAAAMLAVFLMTGSLALLRSMWYLLPLGAVVFVVYDIAMTRLISAYLSRWRSRFRFLQDL